MIMRPLVLVWLLAATSLACLGDEPSSAPAPPNSAPAPLTSSERWHLYLRQSYLSPGAFFASAGPALGAQMNNEPPQWGQGMAGYSRRLADRFGRLTLQNSFEAAGAAALGHEVRYIRSQKKGFLPRAGYALAMGVMTYDRNGNLAPHYARLGGSVGAQFIGNLWMPDGYRNPGRALRGAGMEVGIRSFFNLFNEFGPELKRVFRK